MAERGQRVAPVGVGTVLGRSFPIWAKNIVPFTILSVIVYSPRILHLLVARDGDPRRYAAVSSLLGWLLGLVVTGALIYGVLEQLRGRRPDMGACLRIGVARLLPVIAVAICVFVIVFAVVFPFGILIVMFRAPLPLLLIAAVVALLLVSRYWLAVPVAVVERPGIIASVTRSGRLTRGSVVAIFLILLVLQILQFLVGLLLGLTMQDVAVLEWSVFAVTLLFGSLTAVANAVAYHDLRVAKEGVGIEDLVRVFE